MRRIIDTCDRCGEAREYDVTEGVAPRPGATIEPRIYSHFSRKLHDEHLETGEVFYGIILQEFPPEATGARFEDPRTGKESLFQMLCPACRGKMDRAVQAALGG